jgi:hypothetical protein
MPRILLILLLLIVSGLVQYASAQEDSSHPDPRKWGINDTIIVPAIYYDGHWMPYGELEMVYISRLSPEKLAKVIQEYNRLRNAVYVTYPYAKQAAAVINDVNAHLVGVESKKARKAYIKSREKDLRKQFADPLSNLSVYQGKILMKLIYRETGDNCYEIIKEYKGGLNARLYQTVAFFFGSSLKQDFDIQHNQIDRQINAIVQEINNSWYNNAYKPGIAPGR